MRPDAFFPAGWGQIRFLMLDPLCSNPLQFRPLVSSEFMVCYCKTQSLLIGRNSQRPQAGPVLGIGSGDDAACYVLRESASRNRQWSGELRIFRHKRLTPLARPAPIFRVEVADRRPHVVGGVHFVRRPDGVKRNEFAEMLAGVEIDPATTTGQPAAVERLLDAMEVLAASISGR